MVSLVNRKRTNPVKTPAEMHYKEPAVSSLSAKSYLHVERNTDEHIPTYGDDDSQDISL